MFQFKAGAHLQTPEPTELGPVKSWSYSSLTKYEKCPYSIWLARGEKIKAESGPAAQRGDNIHHSLELFVTGESDELPADVSKRPLIVELAKDLQVQYCERGNVQVEQHWKIDINDAVTDARYDYWGIFKLDVFVEESETSARIYDWKTGKSFGNELKHSEQSLFYAISAFLRYPTLQLVQTNMAYVDENSIKLEKRFTREQAMMFWPRIKARAKAMTTARVFPPKPSRPNCKWCDYRTMKREDGTPVCVYGVIE